jgi:hypothetical protein
VPENAIALFAPKKTKNKKKSPAEDVFSAILFIRLFFSRAAFVSRPHQQKTTSKYPLKKQRKRDITNADNILQTHDYD